MCIFTCLFSVGLTSLADLTNEEYQKLFLGTRAVRQVPVLAQQVPIVSLPASVDWRTENAVTPIKNQGQCNDQQ
jgi:cathepsin L